MKLFGLEVTPGVFIPKSCPEQCRLLSQTRLLKVLVQFWKSPAMVCWLNIVVEHWNRLPQEVVESLSLEIFRSNLDTVLSKVVYWSLLEQEGWAKLVGPSLVLSNHTYSVILWFCELSEVPFSKCSMLKWLNLILHGVLEVIPTWQSFWRKNAWLQWNI